MTLIGLVVVLVIVGILLWMVNTYPIDPKISSIFNIAVVTVVLLWLLNLFGVIGALNVPIERVR